MSTNTLVAEPQIQPTASRSVAVTTGGNRKGSPCTGNPTVPGASPDQTEPKPPELVWIERARGHWRTSAARLATRACLHGL